MSVLLDALKKAAEEKKNADKNGTDELEHSSVVEPSLQQDISDSKLTLSPSVEPTIAKKVDDSLSLADDPLQNTTDIALESNVENESKVNAPLTLKLEKVEETPLPSSDNLQDVDVTMTSSREVVDELPSTENPSTSKSLFTLNENVDDKRLDEPEISSFTEDEELSVLYDSLGEDIQPQSSIKLNQAEDSSNASGGLSLAGQSQPDIEPVSLDSYNELSIDNEFTNDTSSKSDFGWSMDNLPGYSQTNYQETQEPTVPLPKNPILTNVSNEPIPTKRKHKTSTRIIVSLVVILFFTGIGFYGMLYYQEQSEQLERSLKQYTLTKMQLAESDKAMPAESVSSDESLKVDSTMGSSVQNSHVEQVNNQVIETSQSVQNDETKPELVANNNSIMTGNNSDKLSQSEYKTVKSSSNKVNTTKNNLSNQTFNAKNIVNSKVQDSDNQPKIILLDKSRSDLSLAYDAYTARDYDKASQLFTKVLSADPDNVNALLGLGGVSVASRDFYRAIEYYQKVLDVTPNNIDAFEAIANLSGQIPLNNEWEKELFNMAKTHPKSAVLQYATGNIYAKKNDWLEAQQYYFNALALDSTNPDYMMNLAVSFDHLGNYELALKYYTESLGYAQTKSVSFDINQVRDRLISIRQFIVKGQ